MFFFFSNRQHSIVFYEHEINQLTWICFPLFLISGNHPTGFGTRLCVYLSNSARNLRTFQVGNSGVMHFISFACTRRWYRTVECIVSVGMFARSTQKMNVPLGTIVTTLKRYTRLPRRSYCLYRKSVFFFL